MQVIDSEDNKRTYKFKDLLKQGCYNIQSYYSLFSKKNHAMLYKFVKNKLFSLRENAFSILDFRLLTSRKTSLYMLLLSAYKNESRPRCIFRIANCNATFPLSLSRYWNITDCTRNTVFMSALMQLSCVKTAFNYVFSVRRYFMLDFL